MISEKDLELFLMKLSDQELKEYGIKSFFLPNKINQLNLVPFGIADIVSFDFSIDMVDKTGSVFMSVDYYVMEIKKGYLDKNSLFQALGYLRAINIFFNSIGEDILSIFSDIPEIKKKGIGGLCHKGNVCLLGRNISSELFEVISSMGGGVFLYDISLKNGIKFLNFDDIDDLSFKPMSSKLSKYMMNQYTEQFLAQLCKMDLSYKNIKGYNKLLEGKNE